jgi:hypothetical protein
MLVGAAWIVAVLVWQAGMGAAFRRDLVAYELQFPRGLRPEAVASFVTGLSGLAGSRWQRLFTVRALVFEEWADETGIEHRLLVPRAQVGIVLAALRAHLPTVRVTELDRVPAAVTWRQCSSGCRTAAAAWRRPRRQLSRPVCSRVSNRLEQGAR